MSDILQLAPIEMSTPLGKGWAIIFETNPSDNFWTVVLNHNGALVTFRQKEVRVVRNYTYGRNMTTEQMEQIVNINGGK